MPEDGVFAGGDQPADRPMATDQTGSTGADAEPFDPPADDDEGSAESSTGAWTGAPPDETTGDTVEPGTGDSTGTPDPGNADSCASDVLEDGVAGSTLGRANESVGSCGGDSAPDHAFAFTASEDGLYTFDTNGSDFDTVLYVLDGAECGAPEIACDDDGGDSLQSELTVPLDAGQTVVVVVDGYNTNSGAFSLRSTVQTAQGCGAEALAGGLPLTVDATTAGASEYGGSCGGGGAPEHVFSWSAPQAGTYTIHTTDSDFDTVLYVRDGSCVGAELDCDDDGGPGTQSSMTLALQAGQEIVIFADGYNSSAGNVVLTIE